MSSPLQPPQSLPNLHTGNAGEPQGQTAAHGKATDVHVDRSIYARGGWPPGTSTFCSPLSTITNQDISLFANMTPFPFLSLLAGFFSLAVAQNYSSATYTNPVLNKVGADPFVVKDGGYYYMTYTTTANITILKSTSLTDWDNAEVKLAFDPPVC